MDRIIYFQNLDQTFSRMTMEYVTVSIFCYSPSLATSIPSSFNKAAIALSDKSLRSFIRNQLLIIAKNCGRRSFTSCGCPHMTRRSISTQKVPLDALYLFVVTRETVDSCNSTSSATSLSTKGFLASDLFQEMLLMLNNTSRNF